MGADKNFIYVFVEDIIMRGSKDAIIFCFDKIMNEMNDEEKKYYVLSYLRKAKICLYIKL